MTDPALLDWTVDGFAATVTGSYRIVLNDNEFELRWLPVRSTYWHRICIEIGLSQAKAMAAIHAGMSDDDRRDFATNRVILAFPKRD